MKEPVKIEKHVVKELIKGERVTLKDLDFGLKINVTGLQSEPEILCFAMDLDDTLSYESYVVSKHQKESPSGSIQMLSNGYFRIDLSKMSPKINKLVFVVNITGEQEMSVLQDSFIKLGNDFVFHFSGRDFHKEKVLMVGEIYFKEQWRFAAVAAGFNDGLRPLVEYLRGTLETLKSAPIASQPEIPRDSLSQLEEKAPHLIDLSKHLDTKLEKVNLDGITAKVAIVLDGSGSMSASYASGYVQTLIERLVLLALHIDDDGDLESWIYATRYKQCPPINLDNYKTYLSDRKFGTKTTHMEIFPGLGGRNNEIPVIDNIMQFYQGSKLPVYVLFITDGGIQDNAGMKNIISEASTMPIFWQFLGLNGKNYGILEKLDNMEGRYVDNANFFASDDFQTLSDEELYDKMLAEFPLWLEAIKNKNMI